MKLFLNTCTQLSAIEGIAPYLERRIRSSIYCNTDLTFRRFWLYFFIEHLLLEIPGHDTP